MFPICQHLYTLGVEMDFTRNGDFTWRVSDFEELVGVTPGDDGVGLGESNIYHKLVDFSIMEDLNRKVVIK